MDENTGSPTPHSLYMLFQWKKQNFSSNTAFWLNSGSDRAGVQKLTKKLNYESCKEKNYSQNARNTFAYLKSAALKKNEHTTNLQWCLRKWWISWQPDYFIKLTARHARLSHSGYTSQDSRIHSTEPIHYPRSWLHTAVPSYTSLLYHSHSSVQLLGKC